MPLTWLPLDDRTLDGIEALAGAASWSVEDLNAAWARTPWSPRYEKPLVETVFDEWNMTLALGDRLMVVVLDKEDDAISGFGIEYAVFNDSDDPDELGMESFEEENLAGPVEAGWTVDLNGDRARFDAVWEEGCRAVAARLGPPDAIGVHSVDQPWRHHTWKRGPHLIVAAQCEDWAGSDGFNDAAQVWVMRHPEGAPVPQGEELAAHLA